jgi:Zn-dependent metalloprotease
MSAKKKATKKKQAVGSKTSGRSARAAGSSGNGMRTFAIHAFDKSTAPAITNLARERTSHPMFAMEGATGAADVNPETVAQRYLAQALESDAVPSLTAPVSDGTTSEFKSLGTETIPLTGTTTVKFRQTFNKIPVYGSLVTVELDDANNLVSINSALGQPKGVSPVAKISPADAVKAVERYPGYKKDLDNIVPHLYFYFDNADAKWRLVFILEEVPVSAAKGTIKGAFKVSPILMDYVVDARTGAVVAELPRTPSLAAVTQTAKDGKEVSRQVKVESNGTKKTLLDTSLNVQTFDFKFGDPQVDEAKLPGAVIVNPPAWNPSAISAHANAAAVAEFLRNVVRRNNIDNKGGAMNSSINCVVAEDSDDGKQWFNAFWNGAQMVYGQRDAGGGKLLSLSIDLDVVGHEMFHGVTEFTARLEYVAQSGAMNESYSDIFGIIIANFLEPDTTKWNWKIGEGLSPNGKPFRDMSDPTLFGQPANMKDYKKLPNTKQGDFGGVHTNSGIHNKAAYNILTAVDSHGRLVFTPQEVAGVFYLTLTQQLSRTSQFSDSLRGALVSARTLFRTLPADKSKAKIDAITKGFSDVGIV